MTPTGAFAESSGMDLRRPKTGAVTPRRCVLAPWQARCIRGYIAAHLHTNIRMLDLAKVVQFNPFRFKHAFKASFGYSAHQYVIRKRVERAQSLMMMSNDSLRQISAECGFVDQCHLSNLFRKIVGERPGTWRKSASWSAGNTQVKTRLMTTVGLNRDLRSPV